MAAKREYQCKYPGEKWDNDLAWQDVSACRFSQGMEYRFRDKPFVPGWYQYVGVTSTPENSLHYFRTIEDGGRDVDRFERDYKRYDITPAE